MKRRKDRRDAPLINELRESEEKHRLLVQHLHAGIVVHAPDTHILLANEQASRLLGLTVDQMMGKKAIDPAWSFVRDDKTPMPADEYPVNRVLATGRPIRDLVVGVNRPATRDRVWALVNAFPESDAKGRLRQIVVTFIDVTERKRIEGALRESEQWNRALLDAAAEGILVADIKTKKFIFANSALCKMLGYALHEIINLGVADIHPPELLPHVIAEFEAQSRGEKILAPEIPCLRKDGEIIYADIKTAPVRLSGMDCNVGFFTDTTERKRAEEAIRREKDFSQTLVNTAQAIILVLDARGCIVHFNPYLEEISGFKLDEVRGKDWFDTFLLPEDHERIRSLFQSAMAGTPTRGNVNPIVTKDGRERQIEWYDKPLKDAGGNVTGILAVGQDVTERIRAEQDLQISQERFRVLFEHAADCIFLLEITPKGVPFIRDANDAALKTLGYAREELIDRPVSFIDASPDPAKVIAERRRGVLAGNRNKFEASHRCKDGSVRDFECSVAEMQMGAKTFAISVERDVTERKQLEQQLQLSRKLEAVGRLAGGIAHDFNNVLMVIMGQCDLAVQSLEKEHPLLKDLADIRTCAERAADLTRHLLAFSRKQPLQPRVMNLNQALEELEKILRRTLGEDIDLVSIKARHLSNVKADPGQIEQVIMNLAVNARDAMPGGGKLTLETRNVELDDEYARAHIAVSPGRYAMLSVTDTGIGIDKKIKDRVFEPFFTTKPKGKGTGLGLSTVYGIVKQSGGNIWVYSEPGKGTCFKIYLPCVAARAAGPAHRDEKAENRGRGEHVLVVEDESALQKLFAKMLDGLGYKVIVTEGPGAALEVMEKQGLHPDLLITDVVMPGMSGKDLAERLKAIQPGLKVLYMSGYTDNAIVHHGVLDPDTPFLQKPFTANDLAVKIRELLG